MNILEYVEQGGVVRTASGHDVDVYLTDNEDYPLEGEVVHFGSIHHYHPCKWDKNGIPANPINNHGLELNPVLKEIVFHMVHRNELKNYDSISEFQRKEMIKKRNG